MTSKGNQIKEELINMIYEKSPLFKGSQRDLVVESLKSARVIKYSKGDHVVEAGQNSDDIAIIISGSVAVFLNTEHVGDRSEFDLLGDILIIEDHPQPETAVVITEKLKVVTLDSDSAMNLLKSDINIMMNLLRTISTKLRKSSLIRSELIRNRRRLENEIHRRKQAEEKLRSIAHYDSLTKLPNRFLLYDRYESAINSAERYPVSIALMFIDLDDFKEVNDSLGHKAGDQLLIETSERIEGCIRKSDTVARIGGDEFVVLLVNYEKDHNPEVVAKRIIKKLSGKYIINEKEVRVTSSIGIAECEDNNETVEDLINNADNAMYRAKKMGKNNYKFYK